MAMRRRRKAKDKSAMVRGRVLNLEVSCLLI